MNSLVNESLQTPLTETLGCKYPIIQTAMGWVSTAELVQASIEAGAFGFLAAAVMAPEECETAIKTIKQATDAPFGVNLHAFQADVGRLVDLCIDYEVAAISYGRAPDAKLIDRVRARGIHCVPTIGAGKHATRAVELGADLLVCQGGEGGGHTGTTPTWLLLSEVLDQDLGVPVIACGGFKDGRGLAAALVYGADGIAMGTRFLLTRESPTPMTTKSCYLSAEVTKIPVSSKLDGLPQRMILNAQLAALESSSGISMFVRALLNGWRYKKQMDRGLFELLASAWRMSRNTEGSFVQTMMAANAPMIIQRAMVDGVPEEGVLPSGQVAGLINDLPSCEALVQAIVTEATEAQARLSGLRGSISTDPTSIDAIPVPKEEDHAL